MKRMLIACLFFLLPVTCYQLPVSASIPHILNYQGRLTDANNNPLEGAYDLTFRIYDAESAGNLLWQEAHAGVLIQKGIFNIMLGSVTSLDLAFDQPYFLEIKVGLEVMSPRQRISAAGYALRAETAEQAINANTVAGVGLSTAASANKILPLNSSARFPLSSLGLKVYDSGWFLITTSTNYPLIHNLGTNKVLSSLYIAQNSDGSGWCRIAGGALSHQQSYWAWTNIVELTPTTVTIRTGDQALATLKDKNGTEIHPTSGYCRLIMLALE